MAIDLASVNTSRLYELGPDEFKLLAQEVVRMQALDRQENQLIYYEPASPQAAKIHLSEAKVLGVGGGNRAGKTDHCLAEIAMCTTGVIPESLRGKIDVSKRLRGPINVRIVIESLTTTLHPIILPKLKYWVWNGIDRPGGARGHWGWIPKNCLINGSWDKSWSEKLRILRLLYRDPEDNERVLGESTIQFMSHDQDPSDFASGEFHIVLHDEPPNLAIWRENQARVMSVNGRLMLSMTWPDDPAIAVDWIFDEVYDPAQPGPSHREGYEWINIFTTDNKNLDQSAIAQQASQWSDEVRKVRIYGQPIRFSNRIHPLFTDQTQWWCFPCGRTVSPIEGKCTCGSSDIVSYCHVVPFEPSQYPCIFAIDPHPRKPHMFTWTRVDPSDDIQVVAEGEVEGDCTDVRRAMEEIEERLGLRVTQRIVDPNMGRSPSGAKRGITWQDEFAASGIILDLADDSDVGRARLNEYMRPDPRTRRPRFSVTDACPRTIFQFKRYVWDDHRKGLDKDQKQRAKMKNDDYPTLEKYVANLDPTFHSQSAGPMFIRRATQRENQRGKPYGLRSH